MIERLNTIFVDYSYQSEEKKEMLASGDVEVNRHSLTLVVKAYVKMYEKAIAQGAKLTAKEIPNTKHNLKQFYALSAKLYLIDSSFWLAIFANKEDLFWKPKTDPCW